MTRISDYSASMQLTRFLLNSQKRTHDLEIQIGSNKISQTYSGISKDSQLLVGLENSRDTYQRFMDNNQLIDFRLEVTEKTLDSMQTTIKDFLSTLNSNPLPSSPTEAEVKNMQTLAFNSMIAMESMLNISSDGRYVFGGGKTDTPPVDFGLTDLADFQNNYDGFANKYPDTRDAHLNDFFGDKNVITGAPDWLSFRDGALYNDRIYASGNEFANIPIGAAIEISGTGSNDGIRTVFQKDPAGTWIQFIDGISNEGDVGTPFFNYPSANNEMTFTQNVLPVLDTISTATLGAFDTVQAGMSIVITGSTGNNTTYTISSVSDDGTTITLNEPLLAAAAPDANIVNFEVLQAPGTIRVLNYYDGDELTVDHRLDTTRGFTIDINAIDPAFEKAIRAMGIIAQGQYGTTGGLENNRQLFDDAKFLLNHSLTGRSIGPAPYGSEEISSIESVSTLTAFKRITIQQTTQFHRETIVYSENRIAERENIDRNEAITKLLSETNALEVAYQTIARVEKLSLVNYM